MTILEQQRNPAADRITEIIQKRSQPIEPSRAEVEGYGAAAAFGGGDLGQLLQQMVVQPKMQQQERELMDAQMLYNLAEQQRAAGDEKTQKLFNKIEMYTGDDPQGQASALEYLNNLPEEIDPGNSYQVMKALSRWQKESGYSKPSKQKLPEGVKLPEGTMPVFEDGEFVGATGIPGLDKLQPKISEETVKGEANLRKEFSGITKDFRDVKASYNRIKATAVESSAAGDLALIFNYMKMLDPGSTVREGEFANAQNTGGVPQRIRATYNNIVSGERLAEDQRKDFFDTAERLYKSQVGLYNETAQQYRDLASQYNFDPARIAEIEKIIEEPQPTEDIKIEAQEINEGRTATNPETGEKIIFRGGKWQTL